MIASRVALLFVMLCQSAISASFAIHWTQKTDPTLAGYRLVWGVEPGRYTTERTFSPSELSATFDWPDGTYYFAVTAFYQFPPVNGVSHWESGYSNEVRVVISGGKVIMNRPASVRKNRLAT